MSLIDEIRRMSPEEKAELRAVLADLEPKPEPVVEQLGKPMDMRPRDERGRLLTEEEIWDRNHPLLRKPYGYCEQFTDFYGKTTTKVWTRAEVDAFNRPIEESWLAAKRKVFPDAQLPPNNDISGSVVYRNPHRG